jgi:hypothetical protein
MKFLTISTFKDSFYTLPPAERTKQTIGAIEYVLGLKKKWAISGIFTPTPQEISL